MTEIVVLPSPRYTVRAVLRDGVAPVYRVQDAVEGGEAVLRVVPEADADRVRFGGAFRALAGLGHPGVAAVGDFGRLEDGRPYVTSAWVAGPTLGASPRLPAARVAAIMRGLAGALDAIHRRGWVHGDLRPEAVRIAGSNEPVLTSWSRMVPEGQTAAAAGGAGGAPFRAPEIVRGERVDRRADVYALGALAYALLTGAPPFAAPAPAQLMRAILDQPPLRVGDRVPDVPASLEALLARMLAKAPADRPRGMGEVLAALGEDVGGQAATYLPEGPIAGRRAVLERLDAALASLAAGEATAFAVAGEPGMGKSRVLAAFRHQAQLAEVPTLAAACPARPAPYGPFRAIVRAAIPLARQAGAADLAAVGDALWLIEPALGALLGGTGPAAGPREPEREQALIQEAIATLLARAAGARGLVLLLDDWQHADAPSQAALAYLVRATQRPGGAPVAVLAAMRPEALPDAAGWTALPLEGLTAEAFAGWLQELFGLPEAPRKLAEQLHGYAAGCPGVAREALRHLVDAGAIRPAATGWALPDALSPAALPDRARGLLVARMADLPPDAARLASLAAVVDGPVEAGLAGEVLGIDDEAFYAAVEGLLRLGIADLAPAGVRLGSALLAALLVDALDAAEARAWHAKIADWLEAQLPAGHVPLELAMRVARHRAAGADDLAALRWGLEAGARCQDLQALEDGDALIDGALARVDALPDDAATRAMRAAVLHRAGRARTRRHKLDEAGPLLERAVALAEVAGDPVALAEVLVSRAMYLNLLPGGEARQRSVEAHDRAIEVATAAGATSSALRAQTNLARLHAFAGSADRALAILDRALAHPPEAAPQAHARGLALRGHLRAAHRPQLREAGYEDLTEAIARQGRIGDKYGRGYSMSLLADLYLQAGRWREAAEVSEKYVALMAELGVADDHTIGLLNHALARLELGELDRALELVRRAVEDADRLDHDIARAAGLAVLAWVEVQLGRLAPALGRMDAATEAVMAAPSYILGMAVPFLAGAWLGLGRPERALAAAQEAQFQMRGHDHGDAAVTNECLLAEIYLEKGQLDQARDFAERAIDGATAHGAKGTLARAAWVRAVTALRAKEPDEARRRAEQAATIAGGLGARRLAALSQGVLGEAGLLQGDPEAAACFQAMQVLADEVGAPLLRAQALDGLARCAPLAPSSASAIQDAQRLVHGLVRDLEGEDLAAVEAMPAVHAIRTRQAAGAAALALSPEANMVMAERLGRVSLDLQTITAHYGLLIREWTAKSAQLQKLNELSRNINGSLDLDAVVGAVLDVTLELTAADRAFVLLRASGRYDDLLVHTGRDRHGRTVREQRLSLSICSRVYGDGEPVAILDGMGPEALATARSVVALNLKTVMCVPLACKGRRLGVIYVDSQAALRTYTLADLDQLMAVAAHASTAIDNAMLYDMLAKRTEELEDTLSKFRKAEATAGTDVLTGLRNRRAFMATADRELGVARRYQRALSVVLLDVDHFKSFNDTYGHAIGDEVLRAIGRVLGDGARETDMAARIGGEEFVLLCPETTPEAAMVFAERLREGIMAVSLSDADGHPLPQLSASFGVAGWTPEDATIDTVLGRADRALYAAKQGGRNQVRRWTPDLGG